LHDLFDSSVLLTPPASIDFFWLLCRRAFIANAVMLSEIDMELTSQTVVLAFFVCQKRGANCRSFSIFQGLRDRSSDEKKCLARRLRSEARVKSWGEHDAPDQTRNATRSKKIVFSKEAKFTLITGKPLWPEPMSESGQTRHFDRAPDTSGLPLKADMARYSRHVSKVPEADWCTAARGNAIRSPSQHGQATLARW
jgi:hypothetical protein